MKLLKPTSSLGSKPLNPEPSSTSTMAPTWAGRLLKPPSSSTSSTAPSPSLRVPSPKVTKEPRLLGIDIENKPLWYGGGDFVYDRDVCYSWKWVGEPEVKTVWLDWRQDDETLIQLLTPLREAIEEADRLLGHNFRHDWKGLRATFNHLKQPFLPDRQIVDTMRCIPGGMPRSLEWMVSHFSLGEKPHVSIATWIAAIDRNERWAIDEVKNRNREDVLLTEALFHKEKELGWMKVRP